MDRYDGGERIAERGCRTPTGPYCRGPRNPGSCTHSLQGATRRATYRPCKASRKLPLLVGSVARGWGLASRLDSASAGPGAPHSLRGLQALLAAIRSRGHRVARPNWQRVVNALYTPSPADVTNWLLLLHRPQSDLLATGNCNLPKCKQHRCAETGQLRLNCPVQASSSSLELVGKW